MKSGSVGIILDANVWLSLLIARKLIWLDKVIVRKGVRLVFDAALLEEVRSVIRRPKFSRYFAYEEASEYFESLVKAGDVFLTTQVNNICRDTKDNYLLDLIEKSNADFLVTGDKDLLVIKEFKTAKIVTPKEFEAIVNSL